VPSEAVLEVLPELMSGKLAPPVEVIHVAKLRRPWPAVGRLGVLSGVGFSVGANSGRKK